MTAPTPGNSWLDTALVQRFDRLYDARPSMTLPLGDALDAIMDGTYAIAITRLRYIYARFGESAYATAKRRLPQITFTGLFSPTRAKATFTQHSGVVHADLDHLADLQQVKLQLHLDPHVAYVFRSPSNNGLKYGVRIAPVDSDEAYRHAWQAIAETHLRQYNVRWDASGCDVSRTCFVSSDATCFVNPDAKPFPLPAMVVPAPTKVVLRAPYSRPLAESAASRALDRAVQMIDTAAAGHKHAARRNASYMLGGYIGGGLLTYAEAYGALEAAVARTATDPRRAMQTIVSGLRAGQARPISDSTIAANALARTGSHWRTQTIRPEEIAPWRG